MNSNNAAGTAQETVQETVQVTVQETAHDPRPADAGLDSKYGAIGISAVVAALRYKSETKSAAAPPVAPQPDNTWFADLAA